MGSRGPRSSASLSTAPVLIATRRPRPPTELTDTEARVWSDVVGTMPQGWFTKGQFPILVAYCRHKSRGDALADQINRFEPEWLKADGGLDRLNKLMAMAERETRALTACARAMRITHQAQILPRGAGRQAVDGGRPTPWEGPEITIGQDPLFDDYEREPAANRARELD